MPVLPWHVGLRIRSALLKETRAGYGEQIVATVSRQLVTEYSKGFAEKSVRRMIQFADAFPDEPIIAALAQHLIYPAEHLSPEMLAAHPSVRRPSSWARLGLSS